MFNDGSWDGSLRLASSAAKTARPPIRPGGVPSMGGEACLSGVDSLQAESFALNGCCSSGLLSLGILFISLSTTGLSPHLLLHRFYDCFVEELRMSNFLQLRVIAEN